jgi:putative N6-adenine-specific DNA methylase
MRERPVPPRTAVRRRKREERPAGSMELFATTSAGLEGVLVDELERLGAARIEPGARGAGFVGDLALVYRANVHLRTAHRVLAKIAAFDARDRAGLYDGVRAIAWDAHMTTEMTLAVDAVSNRSALSHTQFVSRVVKDAVVDQFRDACGKRPSVDPKAPDLLLNARIVDDVCTLSWDTSGERLHRRGYRMSFGAEAPLKETLAAGVLLLSGYDGTAPLVDPMCGSGTLLIEAAMIAKGQAPGLLGRRFGLERHPAFDPLLWNAVRADARALIREPSGVPVRGSDVSESAIRAAAAAARGAGVDDVVSLRCAPLSELPPQSAPGFLVTNPPYGERLGDLNQLGPLYAALGDLLKHRCAGMTAHVLTGSKFLAGKIGLHAQRRDPVWNGALECRLLHYELY